MHRLADIMRGKMLIGAGTVVHPEQVCLAYEAGARFILSPNTDARVIGKTRELQMVSIPGALTPTEMASAHEAGADFVKLFPAASLGAGYIRAIRVPMDHIRLVAVGGIDGRNAAEYLRAGACAVGVGGHLVDKALVDQRNFAALTERAGRYLQAAFFRVLLLAQHKPGSRAPYASACGALFFRQGAGDAGGERLRRPRACTAGADVIQ